MGLARTYCGAYFANGANYCVAAARCFVSSSDTNFEVVQDTARILAFLSATRSGGVLSAEPGTFNVSSYRWLIVSTSTRAPPVCTGIRYTITLV